MEQNNPGSYTELWRPFTKEVIKTLDSLPKPIIFILLGKTAQSFKPYITEGKHSVFEISHPASASYNNSVWDYQAVFSNTNSILEDLGTPPIKW